MGAGGGGVLPCRTGGVRASSSGTAHPNCYILPQSLHPGLPTPPPTETSPQVHGGDSGGCHLVYSRLFCVGVHSVVRPVCCVPS